MRKHQKELRRERKKTDRARRRRSLFNPQSDTSPLGPEGVSRVRHGGAAALAAAAAIAAGTSAYAAPVRIDNPAHGDPGHFHWVHDAVATYNELDFTWDASAQPPEGQGLTTVGLRVSATFSNLVTAGALQTGAGGYPENYFAVGVDAGVLIPTAGVGWYDLWAYTFYPGWGPETLLPEGSPTYLGVRFNAGAGDQYAWVGVVRTGIELEALAWGYETTPGVPIEAGVPEPGSLALLAFGAAAALRKRRPA